MNEIILSKKKNGMAVLLLTILLYAASLVGLAFGGMMMDKGENPALFIVSIVWVSIGWIPAIGLKVLKPQEALVLTLFGKYVGTLKGDGFYFVNPFCVAVNPAAKTTLNQSGDVKTATAVTATVNGQGASAEMINKKISLKVMTLNNNRLPR